MTIDEELRQALDVEPSPEFLARVRSRIVVEPAPTGWRVSWTWACLACGTVAALALALIASRGSVAPQVNDVALLASRPLREISVPAIARSVRSLGGRAPEPVERVRPAQTLEPAVLIDPREMMTLRRLMAGVGTGRIDLQPLLKPSPLAIAEPAPVAEIEVAPILIEPLPGGEGARQ